jgi:hypothetical protein
MQTRLTILALASLIALAPVATAVAQRPSDAGTDDERRVGVHGVESADDENEESEPDTRFTRPLLRTLPKGATASGASAGGKGATGGGASAGTPLAAHANAGEILDGLIDGIRELEVDVQLLGGRKYMVNDCLGIKVSHGGFELALGDTVGRFEGSSLVIETGIDHVSISAWKFRMRPNPNVLELCKFSKKFEIGGDLDDVRLTLVFDPVLNAEQNRIVGIGQPRVTVRIGNLNLKPLQNNLDEMAKNAVEDGLTVFLNIQFIDLVNETLRRILDPGSAVSAGRDVVEGERGIGGSGGGARGSGASNGELERRIAELERRVAELEGRLGGSADSGATAAGREGTGAGTGRSGGGGIDLPRGRADLTMHAKMFEIVPAADLRGRLGRLVLAFPEGAKELLVTTQLFAAGETKSVRTEYGPFIAELTPGIYDVEVNGRRVAGVRVESRSDTKLRVGVLRLNASAKTTFEIFEPGGNASIQTCYGANELGFPIGPIEIDVNGRRETVEIRAGEITEY